MSYDNGITEVLITEQEIIARVQQLGQQIAEDYQDAKDPIVLVILMKGAAIFSSDLARQIKLPLILDYMIASSYGNSTESSREVRIIKDLQESIQNQHVIIIDDIIDTGNTLKKIIELLQVRNPRSIKTCTLLDKKERREQVVNVDYVGFSVGNKFVVGYGLDYAQQYRNLPYIGILDPNLLPY